MKNFISIFFMCLILCYIFLAVGEALIFRNFWAILIFVALIITILIMVLIHLETKIEEMENRIKEMESKK